MAPRQHQHPGLGVGVERLTNHEIARQLALVMTLSACSGAYLNSVTKYSEAASESASSLAEAPGTMGGLCHERAHHPSTVANRASTRS